MWGGRKNDKGKGNMTGEGGVGESQQWGIGMRRNAKEAQWERRGTTTLPENTSTVQAQNEEELSKERKGEVHRFGGNKNSENARGAPKEKEENIPPFPQIVLKRPQDQRQKGRKPGKHLEKEVGKKKKRRVDKPTQKSSTTSKT